MTSRIKWDYGDGGGLYKNYTYTCILKCVFSIQNWLETEKVCSR